MYITPPSIQFSTGNAALTLEVTLTLRRNEDQPSYPAPTQIDWLNAAATVTQLALRELISSHQDTRTQGSSPLQEVAVPEAEDVHPLVEKLNEHADRLARLEQDNDFNDPNNVLNTVARQHGELITRLERLEQASAPTALGTFYKDLR